MQIGNTSALERALAQLGRIDGTEALKVHSPREAAAAPFASPGQIPPFLFARHQRERLNEAEHDEVEPPGAGRRSASSRLLLGYRAFERLSLLARTELFIGLTRKAENAQEAEQRKLDDQAQDLLEALGLTRDLPAIDADDLVAVVGKMCAALADTGANKPPPYYHHGLQIVGCRITRRKESVTAPLNLSNQHLPFPISFIGCVFEMPLIVNESEIVSLDLSGSALPGLEARGLRTTGGIHLRRTTVISPVSFSGARIGGIFDACDALFNQMGQVPSQQVEDADHGVLNLSKAVIQNEVLLERTRVWGGLSMRGTEAQRSIFLTGALIASPMAVLEKWAFDILTNDLVEKPAQSSDLRVRLGELRQEARPVGEYAERLAAFVLHAADLPRIATDSAPNPDSPNTPRPLDREAPMVQLECVLGSDWNGLSLEVMLTESLRARSNSIRADGLKIAGNFFAEHLRASGRVRLKSARIDGSVRLAGAVLRSGDESRRLLDEIRYEIGEAEKQQAGGVVDPANWILDNLKPVCNLRNRTAYAIDRLKGFVPQDYALDLREAHIEGDVSFAPGEQTPNDRSTGVFAPQGITPAEAHGVLALNGATLNGSFRSHNLIFKWMPGAPGQKPESFPRDRQTIYDKDAALRRGKVPPSARGDNKPPNMRPWIDQYAVDLRQAVVGRDVDLRLSEGLWGLHLEDAHVRGRVRFSKSHRGKDVDLGREVMLEDRAKRVSGVVNLRGAVVEGDCILLFNPDYGPEIKAVKCQVGGRLAIYPSNEARRYVARTATTGDEEAESNTFKWTPCAHKWRHWRNAQTAAHGWPLIPDRGTLGGWLRRHLNNLHAAIAPSEEDGAMECCDCHAVLTVRRERGEDRKEWLIDIRNARTTIFSHPPSAWPHPGALSLDGFRYERSCSLGPLPPVLADFLLPPSARPEAPYGTTAEDAEHRTSTRSAIPGRPPTPTLYEDLLVWRWVGVAVVFLALAALLATTFHVLELWRLAPLFLVVATVLVAPWRGWFMELDSQTERRWYRAMQPGDRRTILRGMALCLVATFVFVVTAASLKFYPPLGWMEPGFQIVFVGVVAFWFTQGLFRLVVSQPESQYSTLGLEYLARQRSEPNRFQFLTSRYSPNEPYRIAALALRETGRYLAANEIERMRIRNRQKILSWRMHGISKLSLVVADLIAGFGFKLDRLAGLVIASVLMVAIGAHAAANYGWLEFDPSPPKWGMMLSPETAPQMNDPKAPPSAPILGPMRISLIDPPETKLSSPTGNCRQRSQRSEGDDDARLCPGWMYAFDLLFPIDLGEPHWKVPESKIKNLKTSPPLYDLARNIVALIQLYGALLAAFFIAALVLRAEAAFVRVEE